MYEIDQCYCSLRVNNGGQTVLEICVAETVATVQLQHHLRLKIIGEYISSHHNDLLILL